MIEVEIKVTNYKISIATISIFDPFEDEKVEKSEMVVKKIYTPHGINIYVKRSLYFIKDCQGEISRVFEKFKGSVSTEQNCHRIKAEFLSYLEKQRGQRRLFFEGELFDKDLYCLVIKSDEFYDFI